jgi:hypothetical protein
MPDELEILKRINKSGFPFQLKIEHEVRFPKHSISGKLLAGSILGGTWRMTPLVLST